MKHLLVVAVFATAVPVFALNSRSAVSVNGLDTNNCSVASPCRSFNVAIPVTSAGGEIVALDSAGYGEISVGSSVSISGAPGVHAAITALSGDDAVFMNMAASDFVNISNLVMIGAGIGLHAVSSEGLGNIRILHCLMTGFTGAAMILRGGRLTVDDCVILDSGSGITINSSTGASQATISNSIMDNDATGVVVAGTGASNATAAVRNCTISGSSSLAVQATTSTGNGSAQLLVESSLLAYSGTAAVNATASGSTALVFLAQDDIAYTPLGVSALGSGTVTSFGNNRFVEVTTVGSLTPASLQ